ncbi:hypothetical protein [Streptomyces sp. NPDC053069]|uniref:hypothetical protein n=1 Tax=Streptomyces sp. NPDC053069 TaxID=3365695 RepID=UPI0037D44AF1
MTAGTLPRILGLGTAAGALALAVAVPQTAVADTTYSVSPVGTWAVVTTEDRGPQDGSITFNPDHTLELRAHNGPDGQPVFIGHGTWRTTGTDGLDYAFSHTIPGTPSGTAYVALHGTYGATSFSAAGTTVRDYDNGTVQTVGITMTGTR